jgi:hypothetical protein
MRSKFTIVLAVLLLAVLALPHTAEAQGIRVSKTTGIDNVIASGNNQLIPKVHLVFEATGDQPIERTAAGGEDLTITVSFGDLPIIQATAWNDTAGGDPVALDVDSEGFDDGTLDGDGTTATLGVKVGGKNIQVFIEDSHSFSDNDEIVLADLRLDVSSLDDGDKVPIRVSAASGAGTVGIGGTSGSGSVSDNIATAKDGLTVAATKAQDQSCGTPVAEGLSVTVTEGFGQAWSMAPGYRDAGQSGAGADDDVSGMVAIRLEVTGLPDGASIKWPDSVKDSRDDRDADAAGDQKGDIATLTRDKDNSSATGKFAIYKYSQEDSMFDDTETAGTEENAGLQPYIAASPRSFKIEGIEIKNFGSAAGIDVRAQLWPMAKTNADGKKNAADLKSTLSFMHELEAPTFADDAREGSWLVVSECVTYLLYPFVTCGATPGWSTGISVSNTSKDGGAFGAFDNTTEQSGSVMLYGFPKGDGSETVMGTVRSNLAAGDTHTFSCDTGVMAGMEGYAIIKANFQHARGMAFVLGNFTDGAAVDVSHGYMAEVITNPTKRTDELDTE